MAARGRPTACTQDAIDRYCDAIIDGLSLRSAAAEAGICTNTADNWAKRGESGEEPFAEFLRQREKAIAVWERKRQAAMDEAGPQWAREAWRLERRLPDEYGKRERHELTGAGGGALQVEHDGGALEQLTSAIARLAARGDAAAGTEEPDA